MGFDSCFFCLISYKTWHSGERSINQTHWVDRTQTRRFRLMPNLNDVGVLDVALYDKNNPRNIFLKIEKGGEYIVSKCIWIFSSAILRTVDHRLW